MKVEIGGKDMVLKKIKEKIKEVIKTRKEEKEKEKQYLSDAEKRLKKLKEFYATANEGLFPAIICFTDGDPEENVISEEEKREIREILKSAQKPS